MRRLTAAFIVGLILAGPGCASTQPPVIPKAPVVIDKIDESVNAAAIKALGISEALGAVAVDIAVIERQLATDKVIPNDAHLAIQKALNGLADNALKFNAAVTNKVIKTWADLKVQIDALTLNVQRVLDLVAAFKQPFGSVLDTFKKIGIDTLNAVLTGIKREEPLEAR